MTFGRTVTFTHLNHCSESIKVPTILTNAVQILYSLITFYINMYVNRSSSEAFTCKRPDGTPTCCADFERVSSVCFPCLVGYTSDSGQECKPCAANMFGVKCRSYCDCSEGESCHHIYGCTTLNNLVSSPKGVNDNFSSFTTVGQWNSSVKMDLDVNDSFYSITTTTKWSTTVTGDSVDPISISMAFNVLLTVIIVLSCLVFVVHRCFVYRKKKTLTGERPANRELIQQENNGESQYDLIDEQNMVELNLPIEQRGDHFDVIVNSTSFNGTRNQHNNDPEELVDHDIHKDRSGYLIPKGKGKNQFQRPAACRTDDIGYLFPRSTHGLCENCKSQNLAQ